MLKISQPRIGEAIQMGFFLSKAIWFLLRKIFENVANFFPSIKDIKYKFEEYKV